MRLGEWEVLWGARWGSRRNKRKRHLERVNGGCCLFWVETNLSCRRLDATCQLPSQGTGVFKSWCLLYQPSRMYGEKKRQVLEWLKGGKVTNQFCLTRLLCLFKTHNSKRRKFVEFLNSYFLYKWTFVKTEPHGPQCLIIHKYKYTTRAFRCSNRNHNVSQDTQFIGVYRMIEPILINNF